MKQLFIHPVVDKLMYVSTKNKKKGKDVFSCAFIIDLPGRWWNEEFNCHVYGCDYATGTLDEALEIGAGITLVVMTMSWSIPKKCSTSKCLAPCQFIL